MTKYRYLKKYPFRFLPKNVGFFAKFFSIIFSLSGLVIVGSAVAPVISYQFSFSPKFKTEKWLSPLVSEMDKNNLSLYGRILGSNVDDFSLDSARNWFPEAPFRLNKQVSVSSYNLSIPKFKIFEATVKTNVDDLNKSLVHYPGTGIPGMNGNAVVFGHSSLPQFFNPKNYKTIFATLPNIKKGDQILVDYDQVRYIFVVEELTEVLPSNISILEQRFDDSYITLVTCVPPGTYLRRLIVRARLAKG